MIITEWGPRQKVVSLLKFSTSSLLTDALLYKSGVESHLYDAKTRQSIIIGRRQLRLSSYTVQQNRQKKKKNQPPSSGQTIAEPILLEIEIIA